jgi:hypothetical protein
MNHILGYEPKLGTAWRDGHWKMLTKGDVVELYDLSKDIKETTNLADKYPHRAEEMKAAIEKWKLEVTPGTAGGENPPRKQTDGKPADLAKPVKVFIMLGQSNMLGLGNINSGGPCPLEDAVKKQHLYPFLLGETGDWVERQDVRNVSLMTANDVTETLHNEWLKVGGGNGKSAGKLGVEFSVGHLLGNAHEEPVMLLKCCIGNRSLGHDLLPPGSKGYDFVIKEKQGKEVVEVTYTYAGYHEFPVRWVKGEKPAAPAPGPDTPVKGNVATVYTHPMARGGSGNGHYGMDSRVYMDVGLAMGDAMLKLMKGDAK